MPRLRPLLTSLAVTSVVVTSVAVTPWIERRGISVFVVAGPAHGLANPVAHTRIITNIIYISVDIFKMLNMFKHSLD